MRGLVSRCVVALATAIVLAACFPAVAFAASAATFSGNAPVAGSVSAVSRPTITVTVYDKNGVKGTSGYAMTLDGRSVRPAITYTKRGDYRRFKLTYRVPVALSSALHTVVVRIKDTKKKSSSATWSFTVDTTPPTTTTDAQSYYRIMGTVHLVATDAGSGVAATYSKVNGFLSQGTACKLDAGVATYTIEYWSVDNLGNEEPHHSIQVPVIDRHAVPGDPASCFAAGCHSGSGDLGAIHASIAGRTDGGCPICHSQPRTLDDCSAAGCHSSADSAHQTLSSPHADHPAITSTGTCTQASCHSAGFMTIHAIAAGAGPSCPTCHASTLPEVTAAIKAGKASCETCHAATLPATHASHVPEIASGDITISGAGTTTHRCSECHATMDLQVLHGANSCATCHGGANIAGALPAGDFDCTQAGCHAAGSKQPMHAALSTSHAATGAGSCTADPTCHGGGSDVAAIHANIPGRSDSGCGVCHAAGRTATKVCATAGCHPDGAPASHASHVPTLTSAPIVVDGVDYGTHACGDCHATLDLQQIHGGAGSCATCHPEPAASAAKGSFACDQSGCHGASSPMPMHAAIGQAHALSSAPDCVAAGCHDGGRSVLAIHANIPHRTDNGCTICHGGTKQPTLVCSTDGCHPNGAPASHASHVPTITSGVIVIGGISFGTHSCTECHPTTDLQGLHANCQTCHPSPAGSAPAGDYECAQAGCHAAGGSSPMHGTITAVHTSVATSACVGPSCHAGGTNIAAVHAAVSGRTDHGCGICHKPGQAPSSDCGQTACHPKDPPGHGGHPSTETSAPIIIGGHNYGLHTCTDCHTSMDLQDVPQHESCATCHPTPASTTLPWNGRCATGGCHTSSNAEHGRIDVVHALAPGISCIGEGCHEGTDVAAIHAQVPGRSDQGCGICHDGTNTPTTDCEACHGSGMPADHTSHPATMSSTPIEINGTFYRARACSECHGTLELQSLHATTQGAPCLTCHPTPAATASGFSCTQPGCHAPGSAQPMHGSIDSAHLSTSSCTGVCHDDDLAVVHKAVGCGVCHGVGKVPTSSECLDCHPDLHSGDPDSHKSILATQTGDFQIGGVDFGQIACATCHASPAEDLQKEHADCQTCHPAAADSAMPWNRTCVQGQCHTAGSAAPMHADIETAHVNDACSKEGCHSDNVAIIHEQVGCGVCHAAGQTLTTDCDTCHPAVHENDPDSHKTILATQTADFTIDGVDFGVIACATCHASPAENLQTEHSDCRTCHPAAANAANPWNHTCVQGQCHTPASSAPMHAKLDTAHVAPSAADCTSQGCHDGGDNIAAIHRAVSGRSDNGCGICHDGAATPTSDCSAQGCHPDGEPADHSSHPASTTSASFKIDGLNYGAYQCTMCHSDAGDLQKQHGENGSHNSCATCHPTPANTAAKGDFSCVQGGCHTASAAQPMHPDLDAAHTLATQPGCTQAGCHFGNSNVGGRDVVLMHYAKQGCATCHGAGKTPTLDCSKCHVQAATGDHQADHASCNTCHAQYEWNQLTGSNQGANLGFNAVHWSLADSDWTVLIGRAVIRPGYPHGDYTQLVFPGPIGGPGPYTSLPYFDRTGTYTCTTCHTGAGKVWHHPAYNYFGCGGAGDCHYHHGNWDPAQALDSYKPFTPPASWVATMSW